MTRSAQIMIDSERSIDEIARSVEGVLGVRLSRGSDDSEFEYSGRSADLNLLLGEIGLKSAGRANFEDYRYELDVTPRDLRAQEEWDRWVREQAVPLFDALRVMGVPMMLVSNAEAKVADYSPPVPGSPAPWGSGRAWRGVPGPYRHVHVLASSRAPLDEFAAAVGRALSVPLEVHTGDWATYDFNGPDLSVMVGPNICPQDWGWLNATYQYDIAMRPVGLNSREEWNAWIATRGQDIFEALKPLASALALTDGTEFLVAAYGPGQDVESK